MKYVTSNLFNLTVNSRLRDFKLQVGNNSDIYDDVTVCDIHQGTIEISGSAVLHCNPPRQARYVSIVNGLNSPYYYYFAICEAVVIGHKAIGNI